MTLRTEHVNTTTKIVFTVVIATIIVMSGWLIYKKVSNSDKQQTGNTSQPQPEVSNAITNELKQCADDCVLTSSQGAFSISIPDGWKVTKDTSRDQIFVSVADNITVIEGQAAQIRESSQTGHDGGDTFLLDVSAVGSGFQKPEGEATSFGPVNGRTLKKYIKTYEAGEPMGISDAVGGEKDYSYYLEYDNKVLYISYSLLPNENDQIELIETVIRTLKLN